MSAPVNHTNGDYATGDNLPASINDTSTPVSPSGIDSPVGHQPITSDEVHAAAIHHALDPERSERSRSKSRVGEALRSLSRSISRDPFFRRGTPEGQEEEQRANAIREVQNAQRAQEARKADDARRSESRSRSRGPREFVESVSRSISRDPFFRRGTPEGQADELKRDAMREVESMQMSTDAANLDRAIRRSRREQ